MRVLFWVALVNLTHGIAKDVVLCVFEVNLLGLAEGELIQAVIVRCVMLGIGRLGQLAEVF